MYRRLRLELETEELDFRKSSNLQGVMFEQLSFDFAEKMHEQQLHPYSQYIVKECGKSVWYVNTLTDEAGQEIIDVLLSDRFNQFELKKSKLTVKIKNKSVYEKSQEELMEEFYCGSSDHYLNVAVLTPTSFRQNGAHVIWPDLRLIYQSLMNKYSAVLKDFDMMDEETLMQLNEYTQIIHYRIHTVGFPAEKIVIPGFAGKFTIKIKGPDTMARYLRLLFQFGEFSGIGVKTGMGMGAIRLEERSKKA